MEEKQNKTLLFQNVGDQTSAGVCGPDGCSIADHRKQEAKDKKGK